LSHRLLRSVIEHNSRLQESSLSREESRTLIMKTADDLWAAEGRID
jgi:hypothetical protein